VSVAEEWKMRCPQCNSDEFINISPSVWAKLLWARLFPSLRLIGIKVRQVAGMWVRWNRGRLQD
jgi:hypothetical protein